MSHSVLLQTIIFESVSPFYYVLLLECDFEPVMRNFTCFQKGNFESAEPAGSGAINSEAKNDITDSDRVGGEVEKQERSSEPKVSVPS